MCEEQAEAHGDEKVEVCGEEKAGTLGDIVRK